MSKIEWTDRSDWNPIRGCTRVSEGCQNCYAETIAARFSDPGQPFHGFAKRTTGGPRWTGKVELIEDRLTLPLKWRKPSRIFVNSASDVFHESVPDEWIDRVFAVMALAPQHVYQVLTKRSERMREYISQDRMGYIEGRAKKLLRERSGDPMKPVMIGKTLAGTWPWPHAWLGVSAEDQARADERIPDLLDTPAAVRFVSYEPALGPIDLTRIAYNRSGKADVTEERWTDALRGTTPLWHPDRSGGWGGVARAKLNWLIGGGESGPEARPALKSWFQSARDQCAAAGVAFFHKQNGAWIDADEWATILGHRGDSSPLNYCDASRLAKMGNFPFEHRSDGTTLIRVGKARAGRLLDGVEHNDMPGAKA